MSPPNMALHGLCPICWRNVALLSDHTVAKDHKDNKDKWCTGRGLEGQLFPPPPPERIRVRQLPHTKRWRVEVGERLAYVCDSHAEALRRADQLAERERERAAEAEFLGLHAERFGDGRTARSTVDNRVDTSTDVPQQRADTREARAAGPAGVR